MAPIPLGATVPGLSSKRVHPLRAVSLKAIVANPKRYSVAKFLALYDYSVHATTWRSLLVLLATPLAGLLAAVAPAFLPLQDPRYGPGIGFYLHGASICWTTSLGCILPWAVITDVPRTLYSLPEMVLVGGICSAITMGETWVVQTYGVFPVPFVWVSGASVWGVNLLLAHMLVLRRKLWRHEVFGASFRMYGACSLVQSTQVMIYPAISVLFDNAAPLYRIALTVLFPFVKYLMKRVLYKFTAQLHDYSAEVAVSGIEICASLYQSMIMQTTPSTLAVAIVMTLDVVHGLLSIKYFMDRHQLAGVASRELVAASVAIVRNNKSKAGPSTPPSLGAPVEWVKSDAAIDLVMFSSRDRVVVEHALQMANTAEKILLIEYFEVIIPIVNSFFLVVAAQLPSARFNTRLAPFHDDPAQLRDAVQAIWLYSLLQGLSGVAMHGVMKYRYGVSALSQLAFVLKRQALSVQGKMIAWLPIILHFTVLHYGADFSFRFQFDDRNDTSR